MTRTQNSGNGGETRPPLRGRSRANQATRPRAALSRRPPVSGRVRKLAIFPFLAIFTDNSIFYTTKNPPWQESSLKYCLLSSV